MRTGWAQRPLGFMMLQEVRKIWRAISVQSYVSSKSWWSQEDYVAKVVSIASSDGCLVYVDKIVHTQLRLKLLWVFGVVWQCGFFLPSHYFLFMFIDLVFDAVGYRLLELMRWNRWRYWIEAIHHRLRWPTCLMTAMQLSRCHWRKCCRHRLSISPPLAVHLATRSPRRPLPRPRLVQCFQRRRLL